MLVKDESLPRFFLGHSVKLDAVDDDEQDAVDDEQEGERMIMAGTPGQMITKK